MPSKEANFRSPFVCHPQETKTKIDKWLFFAWQVKQNVMSMPFKFGNPNFISTWAIMG